MTSPVPENEILTSPASDVIAPDQACVLVVDDDDDTRYLISQFLRGQGYTPLEADSAKTAEEYALRYRPQLILMDLSMPERDGLSAVWNIRQQPANATVPIVVVTAYDAFDLRAEAAAAGCRGYLTKPLDIIELGSTVRSIIDESETLV